MQKINISFYLPFFKIPSEKKADIIIFPKVSIGKIILEDTELKY